MMRETIKENDRLLNENESLQRSLGLIDPSFLNQIESMLSQKESLKASLSNRPNLHQSKVSKNISEFLLTENQKLKELISSYEGEKAFLLKRIQGKRGSN